PRRSLRPTPVRWLVAIRPSPRVPSSTPPALEPEPRSASESRRCPSNDRKAGFVPAGGTASLGRQNRAFRGFQGQRGALTASHCVRQNVSVWRARAPSVVFVELGVFLRGNLHLRSGSRNPTCTFAKPSGAPSSSISACA